MNLSMEKKIRHLLVEKEMNIGNLAEKLGMSHANLSAQLKRDNFREQDLVKIAEVLGVKYEANFILDDGRKI